MPRTYATSRLNADGANRVGSVFSRQESTTPPENTTTTMPDLPKHTYQDNVLKDGTKRVRAQMWDPAKRTPIHSGWGTREQAEEWVRAEGARINAEREAAAPAPAEPKGPIAFSDAVSKMARDARTGRFTTADGREYNTSLVNEVRGRLTNHVADLHELALADVTEADVVAVLASLDGVLSERSVLDVTRALRLLYRWAMLNGYATEDPTGDLPATPAKPAARGPEPPTAAELDAALNATYHDPFIHAVFALAAGAGLRLAEILALEWDSVDLETGRLRVERNWDAKALRRTRPARGEGERTLVILDEAHRGLARWADYNDLSGLVFPTFGRGDRSSASPDPNVPVSYSTIQRYLARTWDETGVAPMTLSDARKGWGRRLIEERGADLVQVAHALGYADMRRVKLTYGRYVQRLDGPSRADRLTEGLEEFGDDDVSQATGESSPNVKFRRFDPDTDPAILAALTGGLARGRRPQARHTPNGYRIGPSPRRRTTTKTHRSPQEPHK